MTHTIEGAEIVRAILNLGKALHLEVIAEGARAPPRTCCATWAALSPRATSSPPPAPPRG
jgi:predicted signal transduction protein with EAL and GGDEF domain